MVGCCFKRFMRSLIGSRTSICLLVCAIALTWLLSSTSLALDLNMLTTTQKMKGVGHSKHILPADEQPLIFRICIMKRINWAYVMIKSRTENHSDVSNECIELALLISGVDTFLEGASKFWTSTFWTSSFWDPTLVPSFTWALLLKA